MSVRRRAVKSRLEKDRAWKAKSEQMDAFLRTAQRVVNAAIAEGLSKLPPGELERRIARELGRDTKDLPSVRL